MLIADIRKSSRIGCTHPTGRGYIARHGSGLLILLRPLSRFCACPDLLCVIRLNALGLLLYLLESRVCRHIPFRRPAGDFFINGFNAVSWVRVIAQELRAAFADLFLQLGEKFSHGPRIVTGFVHDDGAHGVGLRFIVPRIFHQQRARSQLNAHLCEIAGGSPQQTSQCPQDTGPFLLGSLFSRVLHVHM